MRGILVLVLVSLWSSPVSFCEDLNRARYVNKAVEVVNACISAGSIEHYQEKRLCANRDDSVSWQSSWIVGADLKVIGVSRFVNLGNLTVVRLWEVGDYTRADGSLFIKHSFDPSQTVWYVGFIDNGGVYILKGRDGMSYEKSERTALIEDLAQTSFTDQSWTELALLFYELDNVDEHCVDPIVRSVESFSDVRDFLRHSDSMAVMGGGVPADEVADSIDVWESRSDEQWGIETDTSSLVLRQAIRGPVVEKAGSDQFVWLCVANSCDYSVKRVIMKFTQDLSGRVIASERIF